MCARQPQETPTLFSTARYRAVLIPKFWKEKVFEANNDSVFDLFIWFLNSKFWMHASALSLFVCYFKITFARNTHTHTHTHTRSFTFTHYSLPIFNWQVRPESRGANRLYGLYVWKPWHTLLPVGLKYHASQSWTYKESRSRTMLVYRNIEKGPVWNRVAQRCVPNVV